MRGHVWTIHAAAPQKSEKRTQCQPRVLNFIFERKLLLSAMAFCFSPFAKGWSFAKCVIHIFWLQPLITLNLSIPASATLQAPEIQQMFQAWNQSADNDQPWGQPYPPLFHLAEAACAARIEEANNKRNMERITSFGDFEQ